MKLLAGAEQGTKTRREGFFISFERKKERRRNDKEEENHNME
jgi:hypothetical protein